MDDLQREAALDRALRVAFGPPESRAVEELRGAAGPLGSFRRSSIQLRGGRDEQSPSSCSATVSSSPVPRQIGRYFIEGEIGRGGVGAVFKARDLELGRSVALKILRGGEQVSQDFVRRFVEEAQIAGQLEHPGIVAVHDVGVYADRRPYFVMKLVRGRTFAALLRASRDRVLERQRFLAIFQQICQTVAYAHARGVIHRDLKPSNVMVGSFGDVQVMDWGLAKVLGGDGVNGPVAECDSAVCTVRTASSQHGSIDGVVIGTPSYMPPEQARGRVGQLDERADVFGLGAILCDIITGQPPYSGRTQEATQGLAREGKTAAALGRLAECGADPEVIALARDCLTITPASRPADAGVVADRMSAYLESLEERARQSEIAIAEARGKAREERRVRGLRRILSLVICAGLLAAGLVWSHRRLETDIKIAEMIGGAPLAAIEDERAFRELSEALDPLKLLASARMRKEIEEFQGKLRFLERVENLPVMPPSYYEVEEREIDAFFEETFDGLRLGLDGNGAEVVDRIRKSDIREQIVLALDVWAALTENDAIRDRTFRLAHEADRSKEQGGAAQWRADLRDAIRWDNLAEVRDLAKEADVALASERRLLHLAVYLYRQDPETAVDLLRRAAVTHMDSFWIHYWLGFALALTSREESERHLYAALSRRPQSPRALRRYGLSRYYNKDTAGALRALGEATRLEPEQPLASYQVSMRILDRTSVKTELSQITSTLENLQSTLEDVLDDDRTAPRTAKTFLAAWLLHPAPSVRDTFRVAEEQVLRTERKEREALALLAGVEWQRGEHEEAVRLLEQVMRLHGEIPANVPCLLDEWRGEVSPRLVSYASIDAALAEPGEDGMLLSAVDGSAHLRAYLEGRLAQLASRTDLALEWFEEARELHGGLPEPSLRIAECLRARGEDEAALSFISDGLRDQDLDLPMFWNLWFAIGMVDLGLSTQEMLARFPTPPPEVLRTGEADERFIVYHYGEDLRWLLKRLRGGGPVRINCGGEFHEDWGRDRFFTRGAQFYGGIDRFSGRIAGSEEPLFATGRWFPTAEQMPSTYVIPLPPGRYRGRLRFAEIFYAAARAGIRQFDILMEGEPLVEAYDTMARVGFGKRDDVPFHGVVVDDGALDIEFRVVWRNGKRKGNAAISAIEVMSED